jgi:Outer membrane protein beta-barrel domain
MDEFFKNEVDGFFRENLNSREARPSRQVWYKIALQLDREEKAAASRQAKKTLLLALGFTLVLLSLNFALNDYSPLVHRAAEARPGKAGLNTRTDLSLPASFHEKKVVMEKDIDPGWTSKARMPVHETEIVNALCVPSIFAFTISRKENELLMVRRDKTVAPNQEPIKIDPGINRHHISIEPFFIKEFAGYNFADNDLTGAGGKEIEERERTMFSATLGIFVNYTLNRHWYLQSGLSYSWSKSNIDPSSVYAGRSEGGAIQFKLNTVSGYSFLNSPSTTNPMMGDSVRTTDTYSYLRYISVPLLIGYRIPMKRFSAAIGAGATLNFLNSAEIETDEHNGSLTNHDAGIPLYGLKNFNFGLMVKAEFAYQLNRQWSVNLLSSFKNALGPININSALSAYPYNIGVGLGVTCQLK